MSLLTSKQLEELNLSILDYFKSQGYQDAADALQREASLTDDPSTKFSGLLEKKWTSVIRLQKKIMDLEAKNAQLTEEIRRGPSAASAGRQGKGDAASLLPRLPSKFQLQGHRGPVTALAFHPVFSLIASGSEDTTIKIHDYETGDFERTLKGHTKAVHDLAFDPKGLFLVSCSADLTIKIWDTSNEYQCVRTLHGHDHSVSSVQVILPAGELIISASRDKTVKIWELATGYCVKTLTGHDEWVRSVRCSEDGHWAVTASNDQTCKVWNLKTSECKSTLRGHEHVVECAVFVPTSAYTALKELIGTKLDSNSPGLLVISGSRDKTIKLWDTTTEQCLYTFTGHDNWVRDLAFSATATHLLSVSDDKALCMWDLKKGRCMRSLSEAHGHFITCIRTSMKSGVVCTGSVDQEVRVWSP